MPENQYNVRREAARLGGLSSYGRTPDPDLEAHARRTLATARVDREMRTMASIGVVLDDVQAAHLIGLLLSNCGVSGAEVLRLEQVVRAAVRAAQGGDR